jgi:hypothetical protein
MRVRDAGRRARALASPAQSPAELQPAICPGAGQHALLAGVRHPVPARLKAFALYRIDFDDEVKEHLAECFSCAQIVRQERELEQNAYRLHQGPPTA